MGGYSFGVSAMRAEESRDKLPCHWTCQSLPPRGVVCPKPADQSALRIFLAFATLYLLTCGRSITALRQCGTGAFAQAFEYRRGPSRWWLPLVRPGVEHLKADILADANQGTGPGKLSAMSDQDFLTNFRLASSAQYLDLAIDIMVAVNQADALEPW